MALILDKTVTGITSTVVVTGTTTGYTESGYTETTFNVSGYTKTSYFHSGYTGTTYTTGLTNLSYSDEFGNTYENPYLVIDSVTFNKAGEYGSISVYIYKDQNSRIEKKKFLADKHEPVMNQVIYEEYFSVPNMENVNIFKRSYEYIDSIYPNWKSDEI